MICLLHDADLLPYEKQPSGQKFEPAAVILTTYAIPSSRSTRLQASLKELRE